MTALSAEGKGLIHAEALSFALAAQMPRPDAQSGGQNLVPGGSGLANPAAGSSGSGTIRTWMQTSCSSLQDRWAMRLWKH